LSPLLLEFDPRIPVDRKLLHRIDCVNVINRLLNRLALLGEIKEYSCPRRRSVGKECVLPMGTMIARSRVHSLPKPSIIYIPHLQENRLLSGFSERGLQSAGADENNFRV